MSGRIGDEYDVISCPSCTSGYVDGWRQCDECSGLGKVIVPRVKFSRKFTFDKTPDRFAWRGYLYALAFSLALVAAAYFIVRAL